MGIVVQKYGGTSVADVDRIKNVAKRILERKRKGDDLVVVVSAMGGQTDALINLCKSISNSPDPRELDVVISTGEQVSAGLLAMCLKSMGAKAKSMLAYQVKISTDRAFGKARIKSIGTEKIKKALDEGYIVVVAGFQGVDESDEITTLGRGGSDTTAVAIAAALSADVCEIYTDVDGIYTTDPNIYKKAKKIDRVSYDEMLEMASLGAKVLQTRSVEFAKKYGVTIHVRSSFLDLPGTVVTKEEKEMEKVVVSGITYNRDEAKLTFVRVPDRPGIAEKIFTPIADENIVVDMIIQNASEDGYTDLTFTVSKSDLAKVKPIVEKVAEEIGAKKVDIDEGISKVSIVGIGMRSHAGVAAKMFKTLAKEGINILMISTSEIKISCVIEEKYTELAVRVLHEAFFGDEES